jgi:hypothetical protein
MLRDDQNIIVVAIDYRCGILGYSAFEECRAPPIGDAKYENIDLYESDKGFGWQKTVGGRRKNNRTAKKQRKNRRSSRHRARRLR